MSYRARQDSDQSISSIDSDSNWGSKHTVKPAGRPRSKKSTPESKGSIEKKVRCRGCLKKKCSKKNLPRHVQRNHPKIYDLSKKKKPSDFIARDDQTVPDDTKYCIKAGQRQSPSDFDPTPLTSKRQKTQEETPQWTAVDFKQKFEEEFKLDTQEMLDDEFCLADHLFSLQIHFATRSAIEWLKSEEARSPNSRARAMVESGRKSI